VTADKTGPALAVISLPGRLNLAASSSEKVASPRQSSVINRSKTMNIFYIIGVVVVVLVIASFLGLHV
jgi:hypothetical protein